MLGLDKMSGQENNEEIIRKAYQTTKKKFKKKNFE